MFHELHRSITRSPRARSFASKSIILAIGLIHIGCGSPSPQNQDDDASTISDGTGASISADATDPRSALSELQSGPDVWECASSGDLATLRRWIEAGTDIDSQEERGQNTPLAVAAFSGQVDVASWLIDHGASLTIKNHDGSTPLHVAAFFAQPAMVELLLDRGADPQALNDKDQTPYDLIKEPWTFVTGSYYRLVGQVLQVEVDVQRIKKERPAVAETLKQAMFRSAATR